MFIAKNNDFIVLAKDTREELEQALQFMVYTSIEETDIDYRLYNGEYLTSNEIAERETERVGELTMTALDFITFLRQCGLTLEQIRAYLNANIELDTQLTYCQNVFCKVARAIMPITVGDITITAEMVEEAFKRKNGELPKNED
jgi:hypothetical protein